MNHSNSLLLPTAVAGLVCETAFANYTSGQTDPEAKKRLDSLTVAELFDQPITNRQMAECCLAGLWLLHNELDRSHEISQSIKTPEGSFWHAIMHRLEGDFSNSKYWYRNVGSHPVFQTVSATIDDIWQPAAFVDRCQQESTNNCLSDTTQAIAVAEWRALFEYCYRRGQ